MKFKIDFNIKTHSVIYEPTPVFLMGSCFAEYQKRAFEYIGFDCLSNPFGVVYNPLSLEQLFRRILQKQTYKSDEFMIYENSFFHFEHHGSQKYSDKEIAASKSNSIIKETLAFLEQTKTLIITYGSSIVYRHLKTNQIVANCHKIPNGEFNREQVSYETCSQSIRETLKLIYDHIPDIQVILTLSPVRYLKSGVVENSLSKAIMLSAIHHSLAAFPKAYYFPAYEIFMDELRDYRFSKADLAHPSEQAQEYIWQRFTETCFSKELLEIKKEAEHYRKLQQHRAIHHPDKHHLEVLQAREKLLEKHPALHI